MNSNTFKDELDDFLFSFLDSKPYKNYLKNKKEMENDTHLIELSKKRTEFFSLAHDEVNEKRKKEYLKKFSFYTDEIKNSELYKKYIISYKEIHEILKIINEGIIQKIK